MSYITGDQIVIVPSGDLSNQEICLQCKTPDEVVFYQFSLVNCLSSISNIVEVCAYPGDGDVIVDQIEISDQIFKARIAGGIMNMKCGIHFVVMTDQQEQRTFDVTLPIAPSGIVSRESISAQVETEKDESVISKSVATDAFPYATVENTVNNAHFARDYVLPNRPIEHVMHKGGVTLITENTVMNARMSYAADQNISFEFDIQSTATDNKFIIWHNNATDTMLDKVLDVHTSTYDDLRSLRFKGLAGTPYADTPLSSLEDWCEFLVQVNRPFYPEIKRFKKDGEDTKDFLYRVTQMVECVQSYGLSKLATWENGELEVLQHIRSIDPDVRVGYLDFYAEGQNLDNSIKAMQDIGNGVILWQIDKLDKGKVQKVHDAGVGLCGWTASNNMTYIKARDIGLRAITCDYKPSSKF